VTTPLNVDISMDLGADLANEWRVIDVSMGGEEAAEWLNNLNELGSIPLSTEVMISSLVGRAG